MGALVTTARVFGRASEAVAATPLRRRHESGGLVSSTATPETRHKASLSTDYAALCSFYNRLTLPTRQCTPMELAVSIESGRARPDDHAEKGVTFHPARDSRRRTSSFAEAPSGQGDRIEVRGDRIPDERLQGVEDTARSSLASPRFLATICRCITFHEIPPWTEAPPISPSGNGTELSSASSSPPRARAML